MSIAEEREIISSDVSAIVGNILSSDEVSTLTTMITDMLDCDPSIVDDHEREVFGVIWFLRSCGRIDCNTFDLIDNLITGIWKSNRRRF